MRPSFAYSCVFAFCLSYTYALCILLLMRLRLQIPPVPQPSPGSFSREPAPLQRCPSGTARCLESLPQEHPLLRPGPMREEGLFGLANFSCCQNVLRRLDKTFQAFFARVRRGEKPGFPRFRSFRRYDSITFPSYGDGCRLLEDGNNGSSTLCMPRHSSTACSSRLWK